MYALTLHRPWGYTFFYPAPELRKGLENRSWPPPPQLVGKRIALHSGKTFDPDDALYIWNTLGLGIGKPPPEHWFDEGVIGTVRIARFIEKGTLFPPAVPPGQERWFFGPYAWVCEEPRLLAKPIPCRGFQKVWTLPTGIAAIIEQTEAAACLSTS